MRDRFGLNERLFALWYPWVCGLSENAGQREIRRDLIAQAEGRALEIGAGNGYNLPHYTEAVSELVVTDPSPHMLQHLRESLASEPPPVGSWELEQTGAEELPFEDASFDTVVATYVLCSVSDIDRALAEVARVLKPSGHYIYLEHVHAGEGTLLGRFQDLIEVPHRYIAAGCHPNRRTEKLLEASPLVVERLEHGRMPRAAPSVRPTIRGIARPAAASP